MLSNFKWLLFVVMLSLSGIAAFLLVLENPQSSHLVFLGWSTPQAPLSVLLVLAFLLGVAICLVLNFWLLGRMSLRVAKQQREIRDLRRQLPSQQSGTFA